MACSLPCGMWAFYGKDFILYQRISATLKRRNWFAGTRPEIAVRTYLKSYLSRLFAGDLAAFGGPSTEEAVAGQIRAEQISLVLRNSPGMMAANACNATVLGVALCRCPALPFITLCETPSFWAGCGESFPSVFLSRPILAGKC